MVTKRYIKRGGKTFGPYYYESYRDKKGRVKKRYLKNYKPVQKKKKIPAVIPAALIILVLTIAITALYLTSQKTSLNNITGKTVFSDIKTQYSPGERLGGEILLNLKKGELMPSNTNVIITLSDEQEEFILSDFVDYQTTQGTFYTEGTELSGSGEGYGIPGTKVTHPTVEFEIELYEEATTEEPATSPEETPAPIEETSAPTEEISENSETSEETPAAETEQTETSDETTITGQAISETSEIVSGEASAEQEFSFDVPAGKQARIVEGSVKSNGEQLSDSAISLKIEDGQGIVSTDYEIEEEGFGPEYLGDVELTFKINIEDLEFNALPGDLTIQLIYGDNVITSYEEKINVLTATQDQNDTNSEENATIIQTQDIPLIRIPSDGSTTLDMNKHFSGAESYILNAENITATVDDNIMTITPDAGFRGARKATITAQAGEEILESNEFLILVSSGAITIKTTKQTIKVGEPVKWTKEITLENPEQINVEIPLDAENIQIKKKQGEEYVEEEAEQTQSPMTGNVVVEVKLKKPDTIGKKPSQLIELFLWLKKKIKSPPITGQAIANSDSSDQTLDVVLEGTANEYIIEYETPAPETFEELVSDSEKRITISAPDELAYTDIIASTTLNNQISINEPQNIKLYWLTEQEQIEKPEISESLTETPATLPETQVVEEVQISAEGEITTLTESPTLEEQTTSTETIRQEIPFDSYDLDFDNKIDYIEWIVPHLSNQTYELVIVNADTTANITEEATFSHLAINTATQPYTNLVAYYSFDGDSENTQSTTHYDFSTYNNDGTGQSQAVVNSTNCAYDKCTHLDGSGDYILIPSSQSLEFNSNNRYSWSFWVKPKLGSYMALISDGLGAISSSPGGYYFFIGTNGEICTTSELGAPLCTGTGQLIKNNAWSHVIITYDGKGNGQSDSIEIKVYINGTFMDDLFASDPSGTDWFGSSGNVLLGYYIGSDSWSESYFNGSLDEVMFFNETLNSTQIQSIYNNQSARFKSSGEITFTNFGDLSNYTTTNLSLTDCKTFQSTNIKGKINNGAYQTFSNCRATGYELAGISGLSNANLTVQLDSDSNNFYTPLAIQNTTINAYEDILVVSDCTTIGLPNKIYRLNQSIQGTYMQGGGACIVINANAHNTTLDLNGYTMSGISDDSQEEYYGVLVSANNVTIKNGNILYFQNYGVYSTGSSTKIKNTSIYALSYVNCYSVKGVYISGANAVIENSSIIAVCSEDEGVTPPPTNCDVYGIYLSGNNGVIENSSSYASCSIETRDDCIALSTGIYLGGNNSIVRNSQSLDNFARSCYDAEQHLYNAASGGLFINNSVGNQLINSRFSTGAYGNGAYSIYIKGKGSNNLTNVNVTRTFLYIIGASNNILTNVTADMKGESSAIYLDGGANNTLKSIRILNASWYQLRIYSNNSYVEDVLVQGMNSAADRGIAVQGDNNRIINLTLNRTQGAGGIQISGRNNTFDTFRITTGSSLRDISGTANDTTFIDLQQIGNYSLSGTAIFKNRNYGEIKFLQEINGSGTNLTNDIRIENNSVTVLSTSNIGLNRSANITLYNVPIFSNPAILKDGASCTDCYNFTSLNAGTVIFNVTSWTNYSIGETPIDITQLTSCQNLTQANTVYTLQNSVSTNGTCFYVKANNITLNCQNWNNKITYGNISISYNFYGIYSDMNDTTIRNCEIIKINPTMYNTATGIHLTNNWRNIIENVNVSDNTYGIALATTALTNVTNLTANSNQYGIYLTGVGQRYLSNIIANSNNRSGIFSSLTASNVTVASTTANSNGYYGIQLTAYSSALYNITTNNNNASGIVIGGANNNLTLITTNSNAGSGLELGSGTAINQLTANSNNDSGLEIAGSSSTVYNATLNNNTKGIYLNGEVFYSNLTNININSSRGNAIEIYPGEGYDTGITDNILSNVTVTNTNSSSYSLYVSDNSRSDYGAVRNYFTDSYLESYLLLNSGSGAKNVIFYFKDTNEGEIKFLADMQGATGTNLSNDIRIGNNSAYVNSTVSGLNKSANITLYNLPTNFVSPSILRDSAICPASICHNFTSLNAGTVVFNVTSWSTYSIGSDTIAPSISFAQPTENDNELTDADSIYINVSVTNDSDRDSTVFSLYNASLTLINASTLTDATNSINFTNLSAGTYIYIVSINDTAGNSDTSGSRSIIILPSCLNASTCAENSSCTVNTRCVLHSGLCTNNECDFTNMTVNSTIFTLYDSSGNGRNLKLTMTATSPRAPLVFLNRSSVVFSGKRGSNIGSGSTGGNAGIVNITVPKLFNTTNANFTGVGGYTTLSQNTGGNGGTLQLNYHGLIRNFTSPTPQPNLAGGASVSGLYGSPGVLIYNKDLTTLPRDADVTGDGIIDIIGDIVAIRNNYNKVNGESGYDLSKDINNDNKVNVIEIAKIGFEMGTR